MFKMNRAFFWRKARREYLYPQQKTAAYYLLLIFKLLIVGAFFIALGIAAVLLIQPANASNLDTTNEISMNDVKRGSLLIFDTTGNSYQQLPLLSTDIDIDISGMIARSKVKQHFTNPGDNWIEAVYVFPLPDNAAVDHMRMQIGERIIEGKVKEKQLANKIYQDAKKQGRKASLVQQQRPNLFTNSVANIAPGESITITIEYQQTLQYDQQQFSLRFPLAMTPRYIPGTPLLETSSITGSGWAKDTNQVPDASHITPPMHVADKDRNSVSINITLDAGFPLQSLTSHYHQITQQLDQQGITHISLAENTIVADRDFELSWIPQTGHAPAAAFFNETVDNENYQMLMLLPAQQNSYDSQALPRDITYIIDTSGSMHGTSIEQAKNALLMAIERLRLHDRFNIIQFNSSTESLFTHSQLASFNNVLSAKSYVHKLQAQGGTEMAPALELAFSQPEMEQYVRQIIFLTDGSVGNETALFDIINRKLSQSRLFTIGIGSAPNSYFMRKAAKFGRGSYTYISDIREVSAKMSELFSKLENPVMSDLQIKFDDTVNAEIWPEKIPDLYQGEPVILAIKSDSPLKHVTLTGNRALSPWSHQLTLNASDNHPGIARYWARKKISSLHDSVHDGADRDSVRKQVTDIALQHHLVSKYTSLVAVDITPTRNSDTPLQTKPVPQNLPHGQHAGSFNASLPQTATPASLQIIFGLCLLLLAILSQHLPSTFFYSHPHEKN